MIRNSENGFRNDNNTKLTEAKKINSKVVKNSFNFYKKEMDAFLVKNNFVSLDTFKQFEDEIKVKAMKLFKNERKLGEIILIIKFELELQQKIENSTIEYKNKFQKAIEELESETDQQLNNALENYNYFMDVLLESETSEEKRIESHEYMKNKSCNLFKQSCKIENSEFISKHILKLEKEINKNFQNTLSVLNSKRDKSLKTVLIGGISGDNAKMKLEKEINKNFQNTLSVLNSKRDKSLKTVLIGGIFGDNAKMKLEMLQLTFTRLIRDHSENDYVGIVSLGTNAIIEHRVVQLKNESIRNKLISKIPQKVRDGCDIEVGLLMGINALFQEGLSTEGADLVLITDGIDSSGEEYVSKLLPRFSASKVFKILIISSKKLVINFI
jgi:hypothetical protein